MVHAKEDHYTRMSYENIRYFHKRVVRTSFLCTLTESNPTLPYLILTLPSMLLYIYTRYKRLPYPQCCYIYTRYKRYLTLNAAIYIYTLQKVTLPSMLLYIYTLQKVTLPSMLLYIHATKGYLTLNAAIYIYTGYKR